MTRKRAHKRIRESKQRLFAAIEKHTSVTISAEHVDENRHWVEYGASAAALRRALKRYAEAEFSLLGRAPYALVDWDSSEEGEDLMMSDDAETMLLNGVWEFRIKDDTAVLAQGRRAYLELWPSDGKKKAILRVSDVPSAIMEVLHCRDFGTLRINGIEMVQAEYGVRGKTAAPKSSQGDS